MSDNSLDANCLTPAQLQQLLTGDLTTAEEQPWTEHLSRCESCRAALEACTPEDLAAGARQSLRSVEPMPAALTSLLEQTAADLQDSLSDSTAAAPTWADIEPWLEPADNDIGGIGPFRLTSMLGRGGMGVVFLGHDSELNRPVAIKLLSPSLMSDETARQRFLREARAVAAIAHPSIVAIHRVEADHRLPWFAMEYIDGRSLEQHLAQGTKFSTRQVVRIGYQVATALAAAHEAQLIHRDIKPGNILIEDDSGRVRLMDFGLARETTSTQLTSTGTLLGTPSYMAPETIAEQPQDERTDLFGLGAVLYHLLAGEPPFRANTVVGVIHAISRGEYPRLTPTSDPTSAALIRVVEKLLQPQPDRRYPSATAVATALRDVNRGVSDSPTRRPLTAAIIAATVCVVGLCAVLVMKGLGPAADPPAPTADSAEVADADNPVPGDAAADEQSPRRASFELADAAGRHAGTAQTLAAAINDVPDGGTILLAADYVLQQPIVPGDKSIAFAGLEDDVTLTIELEEVGPAFQIEAELRLENLRICQRTEAADDEREDLSIVAMDGGQLTCVRCEMEQSEGTLIWINEQAAARFEECRFFIPEGFVVRSSSPAAAEDITFEGCQFLCATALLLESRLPQRVVLTDCELLAEHVAVLETDGGVSRETDCQLEVVDSVLCTSLSVCHLVARSSARQELNCVIWHGENNVTTAPLLLFSVDEEDAEFVDRSDELLSLDKVNMINPAYVPFEDVETEADLDIERLQDPVDAADSFAEVISFLRRRTGRDNRDER